MNREIPQIGQQVRITLLRTSFQQSSAGNPPGTTFEGIVSAADRVGFFTLDTTAGALRFFAFDRHIQIDALDEQPAAPARTTPTLIALPATELVAD